MGVKTLMGVIQLDVPDDFTPIRVSAPASFAQAGASEARMFSFYDLGHDACVREMRGFDKKHASIRSECRDAGRYAKYFPCRIRSISLFVHRDGKNARAYSLQIYFDEYHGKSFMLALDGSHSPARDIRMWRSLFASLVFKPRLLSEEEYRDAFTQPEEYRDARALPVVRLSHLNQWGKMTPGYEAGRENRGTPVAIGDGLADGLTSRMEDHLLRNEARIADFISTSLYHEYVKKDSFFNDIKDIMEGVFNCAIHAPEDVEKYCILRYVEYRATEGEPGDGSAWEIALSFSPAWDEEHGMECIVTMNRFALYVIDALLSTADYAQ